jgi:hypothetical protein
LGKQFGNSKVWLGENYYSKVLCIEPGKNPKFYYLGANTISPLDNEYHLGTKQRIYRYKGVSPSTLTISNNNITNFKDYIPIVVPDNTNIPLEFMVYDINTNSTYKLSPHKEETEGIVVHSTSQYNHYTEDKTDTAAI